MRSRIHVKKRNAPQFIAIVGGSGAGKTWLATRLQETFGKEAALLSLDDFYKDRSHLSAARRRLINFDHPNAINWTELESVLSCCSRGHKVSLPRYDFGTHTVLKSRTALPPKRIIIMEGLWLLRPAWLRRLFSVRVYINCPEKTRRARRLGRDRVLRDRSVESISHQFDQCVSPMHRRFVEPQQRWADIALNSPITTKNLEQLVTQIQTILQSSYAKS